MPKMYVNMAILCQSKLIMCTYFQTLEMKYYGPLLEQNHLNHHHLKCCVISIHGISKSPLEKLELVEILSGSTYFHSQMKNWEKYDPLYTARKTFTFAYSSKSNSPLFTVIIDRTYFHFQVKNWKKRNQLQYKTRETW